MQNKRASDVIQALAILPSSTSNDLCSIPSITTFEKKWVQILAHGTTGMKLRTYAK
jgi:hypothetical protein